VLTGTAVVVPAHDEAELLPGCLAALAGQGAVFVVADDCGDDTVAVARAHGAHVVPITARSVGAARAAGCGAALAAGATWLATTDADSRVPPDWVGRQLAHARAGADVVVGTVRVAEWGEWPVHLPPTYEREYALGCRELTHDHVHGANLGLSARAYRQLGGFTAVGDGEDVALVEAAVAAGLSVVFATDLPVLTSSRTSSRVGAGFAGYLHRLAAEVVADPAVSGPAPRRR
jgi:glycosyltransferase involved in cell wall biosynthesis